MNFIKENNKIYIKENDKIIGQIKFKKIDETTYDIYNTYVDPSLRGKHLGQKLVEEAINHLENKKVKIIATCPFANNILKDIKK